jgi:hypothetical protein
VHEILLHCHIHTMASIITPHHIQKDFFTSNTTYETVLPGLFCCRLHSTNSTTQCESSSNTTLYSNKAMPSACTTMTQQLHCKGYEEAPLYIVMLSNNKLNYHDTKAFSQARHIDSKRCTQHIISKLRIVLKFQTYTKSTMVH